MKTSTALDFFGKGLPPHKQRAALAKAAGVKRQSVHRWVQAGIIPLNNALSLARKSKQRCPVDLDVYDKQTEPV